MVASNTAKSFVLQLHLVLDVSEVIGHLWHLLFHRMELIWTPPYFTEWSECYGVLYSYTVQCGHKSMSAMKMANLYHAFTDLQGNQTPSKILLNKKLAVYLQ